MAHDVFLSYAQPDRNVADAVCARLEAKGIRCWVAPRNIVPGMQWSAAIIDGIEGARIMVMVFSSHSNLSPHVRNEVERAVSRRLHIIPFRIEDVPPSKDIELFVSSPHWLDAITRPIEGHIDHLAETVRLVLERGTVPGTKDASVDGGRVPASGAPRSRGSRRGPVLVMVALLAVAGAALGAKALLDGDAPASTVKTPPAPGRERALAAQAAWQALSRTLPAALVLPAAVTSKVRDAEAALRAEDYERALRQFDLARAEAEGASANHQRSLAIVPGSIWRGRMLDKQSRPAYTLSLLVAAREGDTVTGSVTIAGGPRNATQGFTAQITGDEVRIEIEKTRGPTSFEHFHFTGRVQGTRISGTYTAAGRPGTFEVDREG